ncbi:LysM domain-containing protein [Massilia sp. R2A-15]|uniref:LysM peptidoglycan-binding domain-containing protein n=1 Tax=Massilia sp. R2A-15 TaxID=3064278 RepID=UPI0027376168|nr:LysM domain-containing protein [Massilia sp. R2A-15]WLI88542.1 LysM domain-containing protein [Massilia sp. R2A-15]
MRALLSDKEGGTLIIPDEYKDKLTIATVASTPRMNICAGVGYLLMRLATYAIATVPYERDKKTYEVAVKAGDSIDRIARANSTTIDTIKSLNAGIHTLHAGQTLKYRKAAVQKIIVRWSMAPPSTIASRYNIGDPDYARKLEYCLAVMRSAALPERKCAA